jgi:hypothetical protein
MKLLYILLFISSIGFSQEIEIPDDIISSYNEEGIIYLFSEKQYYTVDLFLIFLPSCFILITSYLKNGLIQIYPVQHIHDCAIRLFVFLQS